MSDENEKCNDPEHKQHICYMKSQGNLTNIDQIIGDESVECGICGAKAKSVEFICTPAKAFDDEQIA